MSYPTTGSTVFYTRSQAIPTNKSAHSASSSSSSSASSSYGPQTPDPTPPSSQVFIADLDTKDVRSYEHDRQRVKHAIDFAKLRARLRRRRWWAKVEERDVGVSKPSRWALPAAETEEECVLFSLELNDEEPQGKHPRLEVPLAALLTTRKPRKGKGMCSFVTFANGTDIHQLRYISEGDFEIIPYVRPVIALDDDIAPDIEVDEPWEHIYRDDDEYPDKEISYAAIASLN